MMSNIVSLRRRMHLRRGWAHYDNWPYWAQIVTQFVIAPTLFSAGFLAMLLLAQWGR